MPKTKLPFTLAKPSEGDKDLHIQGPHEDFYLTIDYDDVPQAAILRLTRKMVRILNAHWTEKE